MKYACTCCGATAEGSKPALCPWCLSSHSFGQEVLRNTPGTTPSSFATTADLVRIAISKKKPLPTGWDGILGGWDGSATSLLVHGPAGAGKTTLALLAAHRIYGSCVYLAGEEGCSSTLIQKLSRLELVSKTVVVVASRDLSIGANMAESEGAECLMIDSAGVVPLVAADVGGVLAQGRSLWVLAHEVKDRSAYRGPSGLGHAVDVVLRVSGVDSDAVRCTVEKSRWGPLGEVSVPI